MKCINKLIQIDYQDQYFSFMVRESSKFNVDSDSGINTGFQKVF